MPYKPSRKNKHTKTRQELFKTLTAKESRYKHYIPPNAITQTAKKHGLIVKYTETIKVNKKGFKDNGTKRIFALKDKKGVTHAEVALNQKTGKVDWWLVK